MINARSHAAFSATTPRQFNPPQRREPGKQGVAMQTQEAAAA